MFPKGNQADETSYIFSMLKLTTFFLSSILLASCSRSQTMDSKTITLPPNRVALAASIEDLRGEPVNMPKLPTGYAPERYMNVKAEELPSLVKGKVVLLDIWDYTCVNCIRTLPYITSWAEKYKDKGLVIIGIHSPEFDFEKDPANLSAAVKRFGLTYPIIADNEYEIWNSLANKYWPAKHIFDANGKLRAQHFGEGEYQEFEAFIQKLLLERDSSITLPELTPHVRDTDKPGAVCYKPTPETYIGFSRNKLGNTEKYEVRKAATFTVPAALTPDELYLLGDWIIDKEFAAPSGKGSASILINYQAKEANLVIKPKGNTGFKVKVEQDGKPIAKEDRGTDIIEEGGSTYLVINESKMYNIINNSKFGRNTLKLTSSDAGFAAYAFTFTTDCRIGGK